MDWSAYGTIALRLGLALSVGAVLGLNRWLHHKSAGYTHPFPCIHWLRNSRFADRRFRQRRCSVSQPSPSGIDH